MAESLAGQSSSSTLPPEVDKKNPVCVLVLGMAGSGKSSVTRRLCQHLANKKEPFHCVNLDPAVKKVLFSPMIDIRDTIKCEDVMKTYELGPNGAIVTALNLFSAKFDDVLKCLSEREHLKTVLFDTPGQIEVFCWSASGSIITGALASMYPTVIVYVIDIVRSRASSLTFMSNMLHACSILYKYKLPFVIAFNKIDIVNCDFAFEWLSDYQSFQDSVNRESSFSSSLASSLCLALEEFYKNIKACGVSAATGEGMEDLTKLIDAAAVEYEEYRDELKQQIKRKADEKTKLNTDLDGAAGVRKDIKSKTEVLIGVGDEEESDSEEELDEEDAEEKKEYESFQNFIKTRKDNLIQKMTEDE